MTLLQDALRGNISTVRSLKLAGNTSEEEIVVAPQHVLHVLTMYLHGGLSESELKEWSDFIANSEQYVCQDWQNDESADHFEPMFDVLQQLALPEIHGPISKQRVEEMQTALRLL